jgi:dTDP-4-dehydrorhamnose 3,5-epimerase-like enzyme
MTLPLKPKFELVCLESNFRGDARGSLVYLESQKTVSFEIKRVYYIFGTAENVRRGFHAHKQLKQLAICVSGTCKFMLDDGVAQATYNLNSPSQALLIEGFVWREMFDFSKDCVLLVLASEHHDEADYVRDHNEFKTMVKKFKEV